MRECEKLAVRGMSAAIGVMVAFSLTWGFSQTSALAAEPNKDVRVAAAPGQSKKSDAAELRKVLESIDRLWFGARSTASVAMTVKTAHYERVLRITYWTEGKEKTLVRINAPAKEKDTATLKLSGDIYNFLPKIGRTVKVSSALRTGSWMGSHFTHDDLMKASHFADDFKASLIARENREGVELWTVELIPKKSAAISWSKVIMLLDKASTIPISQDFYDEQGKLARTVSFSEIQDFDGRKAPSIVRVVPKQLQGESTELRYETIRRDVSFDANFFSLARLANQ